MQDELTIIRLKQEWNKNGYILLKNAISMPQVKTYLKLTQKISGLNNADCQDVIDGKKNPHINTNQPLVSNKEFWSLFVNPTLLETIKEVIDPDICFGGSDSLFVHRSAGSLHRDSFIDSDSTFVGPDFDPQLKTLCNIRVATYLVPNEFIVIPGSHKKAYPDRDRSNFRDFEDIAQFIQLNPSDLIIFDTMLLHAGRYVTKPKYMLVWNYMARNRHTVIAKYYTKIISSMSMKPYSKDFIDFLEQYHLYWDDMFNDEKHLEYFQTLWKDMLKDDSSYAQKNLEIYTKHWSPYIEKLY